MNSLSTFKTPEQAGLEKAGWLIERLSGIDPFMPLAALRIFLEIAKETHENGHTNSAKIGKALGLLPPVVTKYTYYWSDERNLVDVTVDPGDKRRRIIKLSQKGEDLIQEIRRIF